MTTQHDKPKRWRPRFSVRTLAIAVTLVCCYAACWGPTKRRGVVDVYSHTNANGVASGYRDASAAAPLVVGINDLPVVLSSGVTPYTGTGALSLTVKRHYYFWFFGYVAKLPYEREVEVEAVPFIQVLR